MSSNTSRQQVMLLPECLDDYVSEDNPVRALDLFVEGLDLAKLGFKLRQSAKGRPVEYSNKMLLKLFVYGYLNQIRSSRKLERETKRNLEVIWLTEKAQPDHWTINEFRKENSNAFKNVLRQFHKVCDRLKLFGKELEAIDGTFFKARNSKANNYTEAKLKRIEAKIDKAIENYNGAFDSEESPADISASDINQHDDHDEGDGTRELDLPSEESKDEEPTDIAKIKNLRAEGTLEELKEKKRHIERLKNAAKESPSGQISLIDRDSRLLKKGGKSLVGHNVQCAVDGANTLISNIQIVQAGNDGDQIESMAKAACESLGIEPEPKKTIDLIADGGYFNIAQISRLEEAGIRVHIPAPNRSKVRTPGFALTDFIHDKSLDKYICPQGRQLHRRNDLVGKAMNYHIYSNTSACRQCPVREKCTKAKYRKIQVSEHRKIEKAVARRIEENPQIYAKRKELAELPFGIMKSIWGYEQFMVTGHKGCNGELNLMGLCFNWKRVLNLVKLETLMEAITAFLRPKERLFGQSKAIRAMLIYRKQFLLQIGLS